MLFKVILGNLEQKNLFVAQPWSATFKIRFAVIFANHFLKVESNPAETATNEYDKEIPKERFMSPEEKQKIIDDEINITV